MYQEKIYILYVYSLENFQQNDIEYAGAGGLIKNYVQIIIIPFLAAVQALLEQILNFLRHYSARTLVRMLWHRLLYVEIARSCKISEGSTSPVDDEDPGFV